MAKRRDLAPPRLPANSCQRDCVSQSTGSMRMRPPNQPVSSAKTGHSAYMECLGLRSQMACVPPILVLNYKLPAHPEQVKEELEVNASGSRVCFF